SSRAERKRIMNLFKWIFLFFGLPLGITSILLHKPGCSTKVTFFLHEDQQEKACIIPNCLNKCPVTIVSCKNCGGMEVPVNEEGLCLEHMMSFKSKRKAIDSFEEDKVQSQATMGRRLKIKKVQSCPGFEHIWSDQAQ
ncbi:hypothetical protein PSTT_07054, partial [Puccinia striiformis]